MQENQILEVWAFSFEVLSNVSPDLIIILLSQAFGGYLEA